jgi:hypothetical protein
MVRGSQVAKSGERHERNSCRLFFEFDWCAGCKTKNASPMNKPKRHPIAARVELPAAALKLKPAASYLGGLSVPTMHRLIARGELVPVRKTRVLLFTVEELNRFLNS